MSPLPTPPFCSLQEPGQSYLEKAERMYLQMHSTREKVRAAPRLGIGYRPLEGDPCQLIWLRGPGQVSNREKSPEICW